MFNGDVGSVSVAAKRRKWRTVGKRQCHRKQWHPFTLNAIFDTDTGKLQEMERKLNVLRETWTFRDTGICSVYRKQWKEKNQNAFPLSKSNSHIGQNLLWGLKQIFHFLSSFFLQCLAYFFFYSIGQWDANEIGNLKT